MKKDKYILAIDQGTGSSRAILFDKQSSVVSLNQKEIKQYYPKELWVEQDPIEILESQIKVAKSTINKFDVEQIEAIGITNQRETTILWNKETGQAIHNAIVWQDQRTQEVCEAISDKQKAIINQKTGLVVDPYFSATKIQWILENVPEAKQLAKENKLLFGTVDTWLIWNLSGGQKHITDSSNASRTMLFNINTLEWDKDLLDFFNIPENILPKVVESSGDLAQIAPDLFGKAIPITGIAGDQQAALFGQSAFEKGMVKNTYGTGCFMLMNTGKKPIISKHKLLSTVAWTINGETHYALEGTIFIAGAAIKWLRDQLKIINHVNETEELALEIDDNGGVYVVPAFSGLGAPYWNSNVNGMVTGLKLSSKKAHIVRATLESIAYRTKDIISLMEKDSGLKIHSLSADGGASNNHFLMQFQSNILNIDVLIPKQQESTALGAAYLAGLACNFWTWDDLKKLKASKQTYQPNMNETTRKNLYSEWIKAVKQLTKEV
jgi:glycerol kinase